MQRKLAVARHRGTLSNKPMKGSANFSYPVDFCVDEGSSLHLRQYIQWGVFDVRGMPGNRSTIGFKAG